MLALEVIFYESVGFDLDEHRYWHSSGCIGKKKTALKKVLSFEFGAGEESRTLDLNLGKVALYQLSYSRNGVEARPGVEPG